MDNLTSSKITESNILNLRGNLTKLKQGKFVDSMA